VDGLVHVSELSWKHVDHPSEVVQVGQEVEVEILDVDLERERVSLSLKATQEDPWKEFERRYQAGEIIEGQVTKLVPFGAFVRVAAGIEGLVHISELSEQHVDSPESVLSVGDQVRVKVIEVEVARRRISLSMRQVGGAMPAVAEKEIEAEEDEVRPAEAPTEAPEGAARTEEAVAEAPTEAAPQADQGVEVVEAASEPAEAAPVEAGPEGVAEVPEAPGEAAPAEEAPAADEDVSLEAILEDLRRREGRAE